MEAPGFEEHRDGRNAWALRRQDPESEAWNREIVENADAILLGRVTYQMWDAFWRNLDQDLPLKRRLDEIPKYVVSKTLRRAEWNNTTILSGDPVTEIE